jgi:superfamily II DNA or RNA helicase
MRAGSAPQNLQSLLGAPIIWCRGWPWSPVGHTAGEHVAGLHVRARAPGAPDLETLLLPFDRARLPREVPWRRRRREALRRWIAQWGESAYPAALAAAAAELPIDVLAHQLTPVLTVASGQATRLLLADPVGLGKTVEAGLVIRELASRSLASRVLVLTPASLRDQWQAELHHRCGIAAVVTDRQVLERRRRDAPPGLALFHPPGTHVVSVDLAKQPDALAALTAVVWDVLVVDEAHLVAGDSARTAAAGAIAARARVVLLLSATPHGGDAGAFRRLCSIGRFGAEPPIALVRADRPLDGRQPPIVRDVAIRPTSAEQRARRLLARYLRVVERRGEAAGRLVGVVLRKRALSSPSALAASLRHRRAWLERRSDAGFQARLPFDEAEMEDDDVAQPAVLRALPVLGDEERATLDAAIAAADDATRRPGKLRALESLLRRSRERAIVFTEYRDTLVMLERELARHADVAVLHGGLARGERVAALTRFESGQARLLIATDVAAEGLNLQRTCRLVVHVELPWAPTRLDQRNGRVDRIGQPRRVHAWRLLGDRRHEARVLAALAARAAQIADAGLDPSAGVGPSAPVPTAHAPGASREDNGLFVAVRTDDAATAAGEVLVLRRLLTATRRPASAATHPRGLPWWRVRRRHVRLAPGVLFALVCPGAVGVRPELRFMHVALNAWPPGTPRDWLSPLASLAAGAADTPDRRLAAALAARERALLRAAEADRGRSLRRWQASLFEQRAALAVAAAREQSAGRIAEHVRRLSELEATSAAAVAVAAFVVR